jgi:hypothetical protein
MPLKSLDLARGERLSSSSDNDDTPPMPYLRSLRLLLGLTACLPVYAHDTIPANWCTASGTTPVIAKKFEFDETRLLTLKDAFGLHLHTPETDDDKCGIVDRWVLAKNIAQRYCDATVPKHLSPVSYITGPHSFTNENHHETYRLSDGLVGSCFVCPTNGQ